MNRTRKAWIDYLKEYNWQWFVHLSFGTTTLAGQAERELKRWIKNLKNEENLQLAGIALVNTARPENVHIHCLLTSIKTPFNATLSTVDKLKWENRWQGSACKISDATQASLMGQGPAKFSHYFAKEKNLSLYRPDNCEVIQIRPGLLNRLLKPKTKG